MRDSHRPFRGGTTDSGARHAGHLRGLNIERVLNIAIERPGTFTRSEIIQATGLSAPTVGSLTSHLIQTGVISDLGTAPSRGGRRPGLMEFNARHAYIAGIDLGPTRTRLAVADLRGQPLARQIITTPSGVSPQSMLARIADALRALMQEAGVPADRLVVVVAGAPGAVNLDTGTVDMAPNLNGWTKVPMLKVLQQELQTTVLIENDVNLALLGEHWQGAARGHDTCAFIFVGTGIGSGILIDGTLHHGHSFMAGEIGVMCMSPEFLSRDFGSRGCLETLAGLDALRTQWPLEAAGGSGRLVRHAGQVQPGGRRDRAPGAGADDGADRHRDRERRGGRRSVDHRARRRDVRAGRAAGRRRSPRRPESPALASSWYCRRSARKRRMAGCLLIGAMEARRHLRQTLKVPAATAARSIQ